MKRIMLLLIICLICIELFFIFLLSHSNSKSTSPNIASQVLSSTNMCGNSSGGKCVNPVHCPGPDGGSVDSNYSCTDSNGNGGTAVCCVGGYTGTQCSATGGHCAQSCSGSETNTGPSDCSDIPGGTTQQVCCIQQPTATPTNIPSPTSTPIIYPPTVTLIPTQSSYYFPTPTWSPTPYSSLLPTPTLSTVNTLLAAPTPTPVVGQFWNTIDVVTPTIAVLPNSYTSPSQIETAPSYFIQNLKNGQTVNKSIVLNISGIGNSSVDIGLKVLVNNDTGYLYLGQAFIPDNATSTKFSWDTTNTPNGQYVLNAVASSNTGTKILIPSIEITVANQQNGELNTERTIILPSRFNTLTFPVDTKTGITTIKNTQVQNKTALTITGKSVPNYIITLLIYSNPLIVTVKTDANGVWTYDLEKPLDPGKHTTYAVVSRPDGTKIRSQIATFFITSAFAASRDNQSLELASTSEDSAIQNFIILTVTAILVSLAVLYAIFQFKKIDSLYKP